MSQKWKPVFELGLFMTARTGLEDKLGGLPFGFPNDRWPVCKVCGRLQNFIGQFRGSHLLDLGPKVRDLYLFQCPDGAICGDWEHDSGANAAILVDSRERTSSVTEAPDDVAIEPEAVITQWVAFEDSSYPETETGIGGEPSYVDGQAPGEVPPGRFLLQLSAVATFKAPAPTAVETGAEHLYYSGGPYGMDNVRKELPPRERRHYGDWSRGQTDVPGRPSQVSIAATGEWNVECANFGSGLAYVHFDEETDRAYLFSR